VHDWKEARALEVINLDFFGVRPKPGDTRIALGVILIGAWLNDRIDLAGQDHLLDLLSLGKQFDLHAVGHIS